MPREGETLPGRAQHVGMWQNSGENGSLATILGGGGEYTPRPSSLIVAVRGGGPDYKRTHQCQGCGWDLLAPFFHRW